MTLNLTQTKLTLGRKFMNVLRALVGMEMVKATVEELNSDDLFVYAEKIQKDFVKRAELQRIAIDDRDQERLDLKEALEKRLEVLKKEGEQLKECADRTERVADRVKEFYQ